MRFLMGSVFLVLALGVIASECSTDKRTHHHKENIFRKFGDDVKHVADKFAHDVKEGADDVGHAFKNFGDDVDHFVKGFRRDVEVAYAKAKPYLEKAFVYIDGIAKTLEKIEETNELIEVLSDADA